MIGESMLEKKLIVCLVFLMLAASSCSKKKNNKKLAQTYHTMSMLELSDESSEQFCYKKALCYIEKALRYDVQPIYLACKATLLFRLNQYGESTICFQQALAESKDPVERAEIMNNYACLQAQMGKQQEAIITWQELLRDKSYLTPEVVHVNLGKIYAEKQDFSQAKSQFVAAVALAPSYLDAHYYLAWSALKLNETTLARDQISTVLYLEPDHAGARGLEKMLA
jgi:tetratricopeptide (TPR) repeat protein